MNMNKRLIGKDTLIPKVIVDNYNKGVLSFEAALQMLMTFLNIDEKKARVMLKENTKKPDKKEVTEVDDE